MSLLSESLRRSRERLNRSLNRSAFLEEELARLPESDLARKRGTWRGLMAVARCMAETDDFLHGPSGDQHYMGEPVTLLNVPDADVNGRDGVYLGYLDDSDAYVVEIVVGGEPRRLKVAPHNVYFPLKRPDLQTDWEIGRRTKDKAAREAAEAAEANARRLQLAAEERAKAEAELRETIEQRAQQEVAMFRGMAAKARAELDATLREHDRHRQQTRARMASHMAKAEEHLAGKGDGPGFAPIGAPVAAEQQQQQPHQPQHPADVVMSASPADEGVEDEPEAIAASEPNATGALDMDALQMTATSTPPPQERRDDDDDAAAAAAEHAEAHRVATELRKSFHAGAHLALQSASAFLSGDDAGTVGPAAAAPPPRRSAGGQTANLRASISSGLMKQQTRLESLRKSLADAETTMNNLIRPSAVTPTRKGSRSSTRPTAASPELQALRRTVADANDTLLEHTGRVSLRMPAKPAGVQQEDTTKLRQSMALAKKAVDKVKAKQSLAMKNPEPFVVRYAYVPIQAPNAPHAKLKVDPDDLIMVISEPLPGGYVLAHKTGDEGDSEEGLVPLTHIIPLAEAQAEIEEEEEADAGPEVV